MKKIGLQVFIILISTGAFCQSSTLAERARQRIISDLVFTYVQNPHLPASNPNSSEILNNADIAANQNMTGDFWTNANNAGSQNLVRTLLQPAQDQQARKLQYLVAAILQIQELRVNVFLFNDWNNPNLPTDTSYHSDWGISPGVTAGNNLLNTSSTSPWVWPHANHHIHNGFAGLLRMGGAFLSDYIEGQENAMATILHELTHTQDNSEFSTTFGSYYYGRDDSHFFSELIGNFNAAYVEGIANAFELLYHRYADIYDWLNTNRTLSYELIDSVDCGTLPPNSCLDMYLRTTHGVLPALTGTRINGSTTFNEHEYRIRDCPSDVLVHNETVQAYVFYAFMRYFSVMALVNDLKSVRAQTNNTYGFPHVFGEMIDTGNNYNNRSSASTTHGQYFPIALLDFYTGFTLNDKATLDRCLRTTQSDNWTVNISDYWANRNRGGIINMFNNNSNTFNIPLVYDMAIHFNVRSPRN
jgi:hypothetical protein